jgi:small multidrug resistance pump
MLRKEKKDMVEKVLVFTFLTLALKKIDISIAYAIWSGPGTALSATIHSYYRGQ